MTVVAALIVLVLLSITLISYSYTKYRTLTERLSPSADAHRTDRAGRVGRIPDRGDQCGAERQRHPLFGREPVPGDRPPEEPRLVNRHRAGPGASRPGRTTGRRPNSRGSVAIDPVELQAVIRERLLKLKDPGLPDNERISALTVEDHIVGEGQRRWDGPLVDPVRNVPYSEASPEAINALIRHPQAGLRYYQRVWVDDQGQAVSSDGQQVIGSADQELAVSSFV